MAPAKPSSPESPGKNASFLRLGINARGVSASPFEQQGLVGPCGGRCVQNGQGPGGPSRTTPRGPGGLLTPGGGGWAEDKLPLGFHILSRPPWETACSPSKPRPACLILVHAGPLFLLFSQVVAFYPSFKLSMAYHFPPFTCLCPHLSPNPLK